MKITGNEPDSNERLFHLNDYNEFVREAIKILQNNEHGKKYGILYLDILDFKLVNDFYGFQEGDRLLGCVAEFLNDLPNTMVCGRVFSDHFIRMFEYTDQAEIEIRELKYNRSVRKFLREQREYHDKCMLVIATGAAFIYEGSDGLIAAIDQANIARKNAKKERKNNIVWCNEQMLEEIRNQKARETFIMQALERKEFTFYLQPKVDLYTGEIVGAEALARGIYGKGISSPAEFIPIMEANGSIIKLDWLIMEQVFQYLSEEIAAGNPLVPVSINLSRAHINYDNVAEMIHQMGAVYGIPPSLLEFELTETMLLDDFSAVKDIMDKMHTYGYRVSIDDFGAGYSGVNIWQKLNFDVLKLDRQFVTDDPEMIKRNQIIIPRLREMSDDLNVVMLSEGVETLEQCQIMKTAGCRLVQGYYFSAPVPVSQFRQLLKRGKYQLLLEDGDSSSLLQEKGEAFSEQSMLKELPVQEEAKVEVPVLEEEPDIEAEEEHFQEAMENGGKSGKKHFVVISVILAIVFFAICTMFFHYRVRLEEEFNVLISENINSYTKTQCTEVEGFQDSVIATLDAICFLIESGQIDTQSRELNDYLSKIGEGERYLRITYVTMEQYGDILERLEESQKKQKNYDLLMKGQTVISEVLYSDTYDGYYYSIAVPVRKAGVTVGTLRGIVSAERLIGTKQHPSQIEIVGSLAVKSDGTFVRTHTGMDNIEKTISQELRKKSVSEKAIRQIETSLESDDDIKTFVLKCDSKERVFISVADLNCNDWHIVNFAVSTSIASHSSAILRQTARVGVMLIILMVLSGIAIIRQMHKSDRRNKYENEKYAILARFSDTVLIQYDYRKDTLSVTPNAGKHFKTDFLQKRHYLKDGMAMLGIHPDDFPTFQKIVGNPRRNNIVYEENIRLTDRYDKYIWCSLQYRYLYEGNQPVIFIGKITDISSQIEREELLREKSCIDGLTQLSNKISSEQRIREMIDSGAPGILLMMDIDDFKQINDRYGHASGDETLSAVGAILQEIFRSDDVIGRVGGDEFLVYMVNTNSFETGAYRAADVLRRLKAYSTEHCVHVSSSIGIAINPFHGKTYEELFEAADHAMYHAKQLGKNRYYVADVAENEK